jgi:Glutathione S-transferase, C-terminal domain
LQVIRSDTCERATAEKAVFEKKAIADITNALTVADKHLSSQTYFVGERLTVADISYFSVVGAIMKLQAVDIVSLFPRLFRCYMTTGSNKLVESIAGKLSVPSTFTSPLVPQTSSVSSRVDAGSFPGKWQRNRTRVKELLDKDTAMIGKVRRICFKRLFSLLCTVAQEYRLSSFMFWQVKLER